MRDPLVLMSELVPWTEEADAGDAAWWKVTCDQGGGVDALAEQLVRVANAIEAVCRYPLHAHAPRRYRRVGIDWVEVQEDGTTPQPHARPQTT